MKVFRQPAILITLALFAYFLIPYFVFFKYFNFDFNFDFQELWWAFKNSSLQSFATASIVTALSIPLSLGLLTLKEPWAHFVQKLLLIPQILPALFSILIIFSMVQPFPMGSMGIIIIFVTIHLGFATVLLTAGTHEKLGSFSLVAEVFGIKKVSFWTQIYGPLMKTQLITIFVLIFIFCFASFSVPLVAGGGRGTNLEVLIYEKIFINQNWSLAWTLNLLQSLFIFILSFLILKSSSSPKQEFEKGSYLQLKWGVYAIALYLGLYGGGYLLGLVRAIDGFGILKTFAPEIIQATTRSFEIMFFYFLASFAILILWIYDFVLNGKQNGARHLLASSTILVGFSFYLLFPPTELGDYFKIVLAMSILFFPSLFRSFLEKPLDHLSSQIFTAKIFGVSPTKIVFTVILRQLKKPIFLWFSFLMIWFLSDFAILKSLGVQRPTLGLMAEGFLSGYRLSLAYLLSFYILVLWLLTLFFIYILAEVWRVAHKKSTT